jgi:hypothetical protein
MDITQTSVQQGTEAAQSEAENQQGATQQQADTGATQTQQQENQGGENNQGEQQGEQGNGATQGEQGSEQGTKQQTRLERRQAKYIDKLSEKLGNYRTRQTQQTQSSNNQNPYKPIQYGEQEYRIDDLEADRRQYGEMQRQQGLTEAQELTRTEMWKDSVERDNDYIDRKYPMLDENSDEFDPDIADIINQQYLSIVGFNGRAVANPVRYRHFVEAQMEMAERLVASRNAETATNVARQASQTSVKTGSSARKSGRDWSVPGAIANLSPAEYDKYKDEIAEFVKTVPLR